MLELAVALLWQFQPRLFEVVDFDLARLDVDDSPVACHGFSFRRTADPLVTGVADGGARAHWPLPAVGLPACIAAPSGRQTATLPLLQDSDNRAISADLLASDEANKATWMTGRSRAATLAAC